MGNASKKLAAKCTLISKEEQKILATAFKSASKNSDKIREDDLIKLWGSQMDPRLAQYLSNFLFGFGPDKKNIVEFQRFAELYVYNVRGTIDERLQVTYNSLGKEYGDNVEVPYQLIKEYCESIASSYVKIVKAVGSGRARAWLSKGFKGRPAHVQALGEGLAASIADEPAEPPPNYVRAKLISRWMHQNVLLHAMSECVFRHLYGVQKNQPLQDGAEEQEVRSSIHVTHLLPIPEGLESMPDYPAFVDLAHVVWINSQLPSELQDKWRFLFSSHIHGESFSTMLGRIVDQGPSVIIIEDTAGHMFGGFAPASWTVGPNFAGSDDSFLFSLAPRMRIFSSTGYNDHYQYLNVHQRTMPNGLMMGGQLEYGGIWLSYEFGSGHSAESCSTYRGYRRLSRDKSFHIRSLEIWGVGEKPSTNKEDDERDVSILDSNSDARALLQMAGHVEHSDGIREAPPL